MPNRTAEQVLSSLVADIESMRAKPPEDFSICDEADRQHWFGPFETWGISSAHQEGRASVQWPNLGLLLEEARTALAEDAPVPDMKSSAYLETKAKVLARLDNCNYGKGVDAIAGALDAVREWAVSC